MRKNSALILFVKAAKKGLAKTRIAAEVGADKALDIYIKLLQHTAIVVQDVPADIHIFYTQAIVDQDLWSSLATSKHQQCIGNLGVRMHQALQHTLQFYQKAVLIGSDCGELKTEDIQEAFDALESHDIVIGPAKDGGYYLIGMKTPQPAIFQDKSWSTDQLLIETRMTISTLNLTCHYLPVKSDVDYYSDWLQVKDHLRSNSTEHDK